MADALAARTGVFFLYLTAGVGARAGDSIARAGDVLQFVLPGTAAGLTLGITEMAKAHWNLANRPL